MCDASHSRKANNQQDPHNMLSWSILKDDYVFRTSLYNGSCNHRFDINRFDAPTISKNLTTDMSILNNVRWISKTYILILYKILLFCAVDFHAVHHKPKYG
jgi:hypothetical protein